MVNFRRISEPDQSAFSSGALLQALTDHSALFFFSYSPDLRSLVCWSDNARNVLGVEDSAITRDANLFLRHVHPDDRFLLLNQLEAALKGESDYRATYRWIRPDDNELCWLHCRAAMVERDGERLFEGVIIDLSQEVTGPLSQIAGPDSIETVLSAFPLMVLTLDRDMRLLRINRPAGSSTFNFGDKNFNPAELKIGRPFLECFQSAEIRTKYDGGLKALISGTKNRFHVRVDSGKRSYRVEFGPIREQEVVQGLLGIVSDITQTVQLEKENAELRKAQSRCIISEGIIHNLRNTLQSVLGEATAVKNHPKNPEITERAAQKIIELVNREAQLVDQVASDDSSSSILSLVDLNIAAMSAVNRISDLFAVGLKLAVTFGTPPSIVTRHSELVELIENVLRLAAELFKNKNALLLRTSAKELSGSSEKNLPAGRYAFLVVGLPVNEQSSSKPQTPSDWETALEQSGCYKKALRLSSSLNAELSVDTLDGCPVQLSLYFPVSTESFSEKVGFKTPLRANQPQILIIDDDPLVLKTAEAFLIDAGYECITAEDSIKALQVYRANRNSVKLVLLDIILPGMDGVTLLKKLLRINPELTVVGFSGAPPDLVREMLDAGAFRVLKKPVSPEELLSVAREVLKGKEAA